MDQLTVRFVMSVLYAVSLALWGGVLVIAWREARVNRIRGVSRLLRWGNITGIIGIAGILFVSAVSQVKLYRAGTDVDWLSYASLGSIVVVTTGLLLTAIGNWRRRDR